MAQNLDERLPHPLGHKDDFSIVADFSNAHVTFTMCRTEAFRPKMDKGREMEGTTPDEVKNRKKSLDTNIEALAEGEPYRCPCCGFRTLDAQGNFDVCPVCFWEDDGQGDQDADTVRGGPNGWMSLTQARQNFAEFGACERRFVDKVRKPLKQEM